MFRQKFMQLNLELELEFELPMKEEPFRLFVRESGVLCSSSTTSP